jgi:hypothetical protein
MLRIMLPNLVPVQAPVPAQAPALASVQTPPAPVQTPPAKPQRTRVQAPVQDPAPVVVNESPVVDTTLVADVDNAPVVVQHVAVVGQDQVETPMEVEDEDTLLQRLFFKRFGRALPDEKEKDNEVDQIKFVIDLTDDTEEMEDDTTPLLISNPVVKSEPIEIVNVAKVNNVTNESGVADVAKRRSFRLERLELAKARKAITEFGKSLRKSEVIPEKEAPLAAGTENVIADTDTNMSEDVSVNPESVNPIETAEQVIAESDRRAEQVIAESDAAIKASEEFVAEFGDTPVDEFDVDIEPLC